jgi:hypothetical protein
MFAYALNKSEAPNGITATSLHPGAIFQSEFNRTLPSFVVSFLRCMVVMHGQALGRQY